MSYLKDYIGLLSGSAGSAILSFISSILLARFIGRTEYGLYSAFLALAILFATISDLGMTSSYIRYSSPLHSRREDASLSKVTYSALRMKFRIGLIFFACGTVSISMVIWFYELWEYSAIILAPIGGIVLSFFNFALGAQQVRESFKKCSTMFIIKGFSFLMFVLAVLILGIHDSIMVSIGYILTLLMVVLIFRSGITKFITSRPAAAESHRLGRELLGFGKWVAVGATSFSLFEQIPIASSLMLFGPENTADLSVAVALIAVMGVMSIPLSTMVIPQLSRIGNHLDYREYLKQVYRFVVPISVTVLILAIVFSQPGIEFAYGPEYSAASPLFSILILPFAFAMIALPLNSALIYVFNKPAIVASTNLIQLTAIVASVLIFMQDGSILTFVLVYSGIRLTGTISVMAIAIRSFSEWRRRTDENGPAQVIDQK